MRSHVAHEAHLVSTAVDCVVESTALKRSLVWHCGHAHSKVRCSSPDAAADDDEFYMQRSVVA